MRFAVQPLLRVVVIPNMTTVTTMTMFPFSKPSQTEKRSCTVKVLRIVVVFRGDDSVSAFDNIVAADVEDHSLRCKMLGVLRGHGIG